jgi:hypothetical protein
MRIAVLGPLEVTANDSAPVDVPGRWQRVLLGVLATSAPAPVAEHRLIEALGSAGSPPVDVETLRAEIRHLRMCLEPGLPDRSSGQYVLHRGSGYALAVARGDVDALRFADLAARGHASLAAGDADDAVRLLATAVGLWTGEPYCDWPEAGFAEAERRRLTAIRAGAVSDLAQARELRAHQPEPARSARAIVEWPTERPTVVVPKPRAPSQAFSLLPDMPPDVVLNVVDVVDDVGRADSPASTTHRRAALVAALVAVVAASFVGARWSADRQQATDRSATVTDADRLAAFSGTEGALDLSLLLAAEAFRLANTSTTRSALTAAVDGHGRVERAASFSGLPRNPVLSGYTLSFGIGNSVIGWRVASKTIPRVLRPVPAAWGAWLVAAPTSADGVVMAAGVAEAGPWLRMVSELDGSTRLLLEGDEVGGRPVGGAVTADGRVLLVIAGPDPTTPDDVSRWHLLDIDAADGTRRDTGVGGLIRVPPEGVKADFADDAGSFVVWDATGTFPATLVQVPDGQQVPIPMPDRRGHSLGFRAFPGGAVELWDDGLFAVIDRSGTTTQLINVHQHPVRDVAVSPDGRWAVTAGAGSEVYRWDVDPASGRWSGPELLLGHTGDVVGVEVDSTGRRLASVALDHTAIIWDMRGRPVNGPEVADPDSRLDAACRIAGRDFTPDEWRRFLPGRPWQPTCSDLR